MKLSHNILDINSDNFTEKALDTFKYQAQNNPVYAEYIKRIGCNPNTVNTLDRIPFLPINFFKTHSIITAGLQTEKVFLSSGTTSQTHSKHCVANLSLYQESFRASFRFFFGPVSDYTILALLPSYVEQGNSSLVYMVSDLINQSQKEASGFYLDDYKLVADTLIQLDKSGEKTLLIGVSYALLDLIEFRNFTLKNTIIMETGGMKGRRKELIKSELHSRLKKGFGVSKIYSEYGMTELLSQAYSLGGEHFYTPPWMKILIREIEDPFTLLPTGKSGGINVIDLANRYSCSFIETQDLGRKFPDGTFEVLGRYDHSDIRGCNLMV